MCADISREYNSVKIHPHFGFITKTSAHQRIRDEINYYRALPPELAAFFPRLIESLVSDSASWMTLEQYGYPNLGEYLLDPQSKVDWRKTFTELAMTLKYWSDINSAPGTRACAEKMYIDKPIREYENLAGALSHDLFSSPTLSINGRSYLNFERCWPEIKRAAERELLPYQSSFFHGDCCFSNILFCQPKNIFRFIDPRGSFGKPGIHGDIRYDVAKLYQSCNGGYEFLMDDRFEFNSESETSYTLELPQYRAECRAAFEDAFFGEYSKREITMIEGLIHIGTADRHFDSERRQIALYLTGVMLLNEALEL